MSRIRYIILAMAAMLFFGQVVWYWDYSMDDAFITFTYAENMVDGHGLVFNVGDKPVEAYSNSLWMFLLAGLYLVGLPTVLAAKVLGVAFFAAAGWLWFWYFGRDNSNYGWLAGPLFLACPLTPFWAVSGLELGLHAFAIAAAIVFMLRRSRWSCLFLALIVWGRPEGFITAATMIMAIMATDLFKKNFRLKKYLWQIITIILAIAAITAFRLIVFGRPLPNTFYAKTEEIGFYVFALIGMVVRFLPIFVLLLGGAYYAIKDRFSDRTLVICLVIFFAQFIVSTMVDPVMNYLFRYMSPFMGAAVLATLIVVTKIKKPVYRALALALIILSLLSPVEKVLRHLWVEREIMSAQDKVIEWAKGLSPGTCISLTDIGRIPYYSDQYYIDIWGLASYNIGRYGFNPVHEYLKFPDYFLLVGHVRQDGFAILRLGRERLIVKNRGFRETYPYEGILSPDGVPSDSAGYHYLILKKNQRAVDSLLELYPIR